MKALLDSNIIIHLAQGKIDFDSFADDYEELCISVTNLCGSFGIYVSR